MNENRLIKHESMINSKTYSEEELYVDDTDKPEDDMMCSICEKEFTIMRHKTNVDKKKQQKKPPGYSRN